MHHPTMQAGVEKQLTKLRENLPQTVVLFGEPGINLDAIAHWLAGKQHQTLMPTKSDYSTQLNINIRAIRTLYETSRSKHDRQVIVIEQAELITHDAQHALLKLLEEPASNTHFILSTTNYDQLLPTVRSRSVNIHVPRLTQSEFRSWLHTQQIDATTQKQLSFVADGRTELASQLIAQPEKLQALATIVRDANVFIGQDTYGAAQIATRYSSSRDQAVSMVDSAITILRHSVYARPSHEHIRALERLETVQVNLKNNAQPRLQLMSYVIQ